MAVSATSVALQGAANFSTKWNTKRIHRKLDDRDDVLDEALQLLEEHDTSVFPVVTKIAGLDLSIGSAAASAVQFTIGGAGCTATSTVTLTVGAATIAATPGTNVVDVDAGPLGIVALNAVVSGGAVSDLVPVYLRIDGVLCPTLTFALLA